MKIKRIILRMFSIFMLIIAFGTFTLNIVSGILVLLVAIGCNLLAWDFFKDNKTVF